MGIVVSNLSSGKLSRTGSIHGVKSWFQPKVGSAASPLEEHKVHDDDADADIVNSI